MNPLISVIVPVYNVDKYLNRCIESIVNQTYTNLEIILVDDGSPDNCPKMCDGWAEKDDRIIVIHKENGGLSDARNAGLEIATGEYVCFVDSDDWISKEFVQRLYEYATEKDCDLVECSYLVTSGEVNQVDTSLVKTHICNTDEAMKLHIEDKMFKQVVWNKLYKKNLLDIQFETGKYHEDVYWTYQVIAKCEKLAHIELPLYYYFQREDSIMGESYSIKRLDAVEASKLRCKFISEKFTNLAGIAQKGFIGTCMYHSQLLLNSNIENKRDLIKKLNFESKTIGNKWKKNSNLSVKYKIWYYLYLSFPILTSRIRNGLKLGI